ncbi:MAG: S24 family peptidase [Gammaproteobacteria bacterium]
MEGCAQNEPFALQVTDSSMEPEFPKGCIVVSEPNGPLEHGCYVIGNDGEELIFRQLLIEGEQWSLHALQPGIDDVLISGRDAIHGRVIQRAGTRRKDRKSYL